MMIRAAKENGGLGGNVLPRCALAHWHAQHAALRRAHTAVAHALRTRANIQLHVRRRVQIDAVNQVLAKGDLRSDDVGTR